MTFAAIHSESRIPWHAPFAQKMQMGMNKVGIQTVITNSRERVSCDFAVLLGTSLWADIEADGRFLLVDRCSFGDTNEWVSLVWDGHGRRGNHRVPQDLGNRWERIGVRVEPWRSGGDKIVLAGQTAPYSGHWATLHDWYATHPEATHFRPHPAQSVLNGMLNLPTWRTFDDVARLITLNSSVAVAAILDGAPTTCDDMGAMAYPGFDAGSDRLPWLQWLAWTQWHHDEVSNGESIRHIFDSVQ